jgi:hypothetical protein
MPRHRLGIKKLTLIKGTTLHEPMLPAPTMLGTDDTRCSAVS